MNKNHFIPALDKALAVLEDLGRLPGGATQAELVARLGVTPSTCYRILQTLQHHDFVKKQDGGRFDVSNGLLTAALRLVERARRFEYAQPVLEALAAQTGFACKLSIRQGFEQVTVLRAESPAAVSVSGRVGARFPIIEGSVGAALLGDAEAAEIAALAEACPDDLIERRDVALVLRRIAELRRNGFTLNVKENRWNVAAMSVPVRDARGQLVAALTVLGFHGEFADPAGLAKALVAAAQKVGVTL